MKRFWDYWKTNFIVGKESMEFTVFALFCGIQVIVALFWFFGWESDYLKEREKIIGKVEMVLVAFFIVGGLVWLPFKKHEAQQKAINEYKSKADTTIETNARAFQVKAIVTIYRKLVKVHTALASYIIHVNNRRAEQKDALEKQLTDAINVFWESFQENKIYIPQNTSPKIVKIQDFIDEIRSDHYFNLIALDMGNEDYTSLRRRGDDLSAKMRELGAISKSLEIEFQKIMGFPIETSPTTS